MKYSKSDVTALEIRPGIHQFFFYEKIIDLRHFVNNVHKKTIKTSEMKIPEMPIKNYELYD